MPRPRADMVARPALDAALEAALAGASLVLLCAPAGYGKTTALVQQLSRPLPGRAFAWLTVSDDDDLPSLLSCLVAALDPLDLPWRQSPDELPSLVLGGNGPHAVVSALVQALAHAEAGHGVIVLDDLHRLADERAYAFLNLLIARLPANWTLAATSRKPPPLAPGRLRMQGQLAEFGEAHLRFGPQEVRSLLDRQSGSDFDATEQLYRATQGWPVGVASLSRALDGLAAVDSAKVRDWRRRLFDYLAVEVLNELPVPMREFLVRCSVLRELTAKRCAAVTGDPRAAQWLDELEHRDLFVAVLDTEPLTLRLHDLFRDFLEARLTAEQPLEKPGLLMRAAEGEPDIGHRSALLLRAGAAERALADVMDHAADLVLGGEEVQLLRVIDQFPPRMRETEPELSFARGLCAWHGYRWRTMANALMDSTAGFERRGRSALARKAHALAVIALHAGGRSTEAHQLWPAEPAPDGEGQTTMACLLADYMMSLLHGPADASAARLWRLIEALSGPRDLQWVCFPHMHMGFGRWGLRAPMEALARALANAPVEEHRRLRTSAMLHEATLALWQGNVTHARELRQALEREATWLGEPLTLKVPLQYMLAMEKHVTGDAEGASALLCEMTANAQGNPERRSWAMYRYMEVAVEVANDQWEAAEELHRKLDAVVEWPWPYLRFAHACLSAELALHRGNAHGAAAALRPLVEPVADVDNLGIRTRLCLTLARAELRLGDAPAAWRVLSPALEELRSSRERLGFLLAGPTALSELAAATWPPDADVGLLALLQQVLSEARRLRSHTADEIVQAESAVLTDREWQVLALIRKGYTNKLIARKLDMSPHTVKRHVARILDRTGQASRLGAASWSDKHPRRASPSGHS
jgi:LuxR family maltose regulon positive regulatory protein